MFNPTDVQGNILRGYRKPRVRYLILEITDRNEARRWLAASVSGRNDSVQQITTEEPWGKTKPDTTFNIGLTFEGLRALGVTQPSLDTFPTEFGEGMTARAVKLGDVGAGAPDKWPKPFNEPARIHLIASIYADEIGVDRGFQVHGQHGRWVGRVIQLDCGGKLTMDRGGKLTMAVRSWLPPRIEELGRC